MKLIETAIDQNGDSYIHSQSVPKSWKMKGHLVTDLYFSSQCPPNLMLSSEALPEKDFNLAPGEIRFFRTEIYPTKSEYKKLSALNKIPFEKFFFHSTTTIDYINVLKGKLTLIVGNEKIDLKEGDHVIQRGAAHAWHNYTDKLAVISGIMIGVKPPSYFKKIEIMVNLYDET